MFDKVLQFVAPHHCYFCSKVGSNLCESCIYNIVNDANLVCLGCRLPTVQGTCKQCRQPWKKSWVISEHSGQTATLLHDFKWSRMYSAHKGLASLLDSALPILPSNTVVTYVPTIAKHKRIRGYDHMKLIAKQFARTRKLSVEDLIDRKTNTVQHLANKRQRQIQAEEAYSCSEVLDSKTPYLVLDDIVTTGSTIKAATHVLERAGAQEIWVAAIARQPLIK